jgi:wobble nucleotide-excising tRNase
MMNLHHLTGHYPASFDSSQHEMSGLSKFNYVFGSNGTGKTTISKIIAKEDNYPSCQLRWKGNSKLDTFVYNRDFIENNFGQVAELKGIFTLGEKDKTTLDNLTTAKSEKDGLLKKHQQLIQTLQGEDGLGEGNPKLAALETNFEEHCWNFKKKYENEFLPAFRGSIQSKKTFKERLLKEYQSNNAILRDLDELKIEAESIYGKNPETVIRITNIEMSRIIEHEHNPILTKNIVGKTDVDIAAMIQKLGNSDWVQKGKSYYDTNNNFCPFCQQPTPSTLEKSLNDFFDVSYRNDVTAIKNLFDGYTHESDQIQITVTSIISNDPRFIDVKQLNIQKELLGATINLNIQRLEQKLREPSTIIKLESLVNYLKGINNIIAEANAQIDKHNHMVTNLYKEKQRLNAEIWRYLLDKELDSRLNSYLDSKRAIIRTIEELTTKINTAEEAIQHKEIEIRTLERQTSSIQPTINDINSLLASFGFIGFRIAQSENSNFYKIIRDDGSDAKESLSEGEKTFVTFLYFYHLLKGSDSEDGIVSDRIIVFDDPVSSLDSDILFIVSSLIKGLIDNVRKGKGHIKQIFVLTHNVYFHKELTYNSQRKDKAMKEETFWIVKKPEKSSIIQKHDSNPIKNSYELLWQEVRNPEKSNHTIQNTLRRILENYFKILGNINPKSICGKFEGRDKVICNSLFSWVNDGSHSAYDDLYVSIDEKTVTAYLSVFKRIFENEGHIAHYRMMMGDSYVEQDTEAVPQTIS